jgi:hypothetical protein
VFSKSLRNPIPSYPIKTGHYGITGSAVRRIRALASIEQKVSVNLANHSYKNKLFEKRDLDKGDESINYFIDSKGFRFFRYAREYRVKKKCRVTHKCQ